MKTFVKLFAIVASIAALASCAKESPDAEGNFNEGANKSKEGYVQYTFAFDCDDSKTTISDDLKVSWEEGKDSVLVIWGSTAEDTAKAAISEGSIVFEAPEEVETFYAVYPWTATASLADGNLSVALPKTYDGSWRQANYMAAKTTKTDAKFNFKFICSVIKFKITQENTTKMTLRSNCEENTSGTVTFGFDADNVPTGFVASSVRSEISTGALEKDTWAYLPILPEVSLPYGLAVRKTVDGTLTAALSISALSTTRGDVVNLGEIQKKVRTDFFVKETATGDGSGKDWDNAADAKLLVKYFSPFIYKSDGTRLSDTDKFYGVTNAWRLHQTKFYLAAGTYDLKDGSAVSLAWNFATDVNFTINGGYPATAVGTSLEGRDVDANVTTLTTSATGSNVRIFYAANCYLRHIIFDGLYFNVPNGISGRGFIIYQNSSGETNKMSNSKALIHFNNCRIKNSTHSNYGLININNRWSKVLIENCVFEGNSTNSSNGGAVICIDGCKNADIENCIFKNNTVAGNGNGGAIALKLNDEAKNTDKYWPTVNIKHCSFEGNSTTTCTATNAGRGGAINIIGNNTKVPVVNIDSCSFSGNSAFSTGGAIGYDYCTLTIDSCSFNGNSCSSYYKSGTKGGNFGGGAISGVYNKTTSSSIQSYTNPGIVSIRNSVLEDNSSYGRGGALHFGTETVYIDNCLFKDNVGSNKANGGGGIFCNKTTSYISNTMFDGNITNNGSGGAICIKSQNSVTYLANNTFKNNKAAQNGNAVGTYDDSDQTKIGLQVYMYGNTFYNNGDNTKSSCQCPPWGLMYLANNTFCESSTPNRGIVEYFGGSETSPTTKNYRDNALTFNNNIILGTDSKSIGSYEEHTMISQGKNIYNALSNVTLTAGVGDVAGVAKGDVFPSPALDANGKLPWSGTVTGLEGYATAASVKTAIQTASATFYNWLNDNNYWLSGSTWWPGAYQPAE